ncbi:hypothetical protein Y1Q_0002748 [Alligator mississippiensis]|uniref:Uncharacterized protein n=1 Tax=Alligator mississippiensis TaxID=8496 RepID=A0A151NYZ7_ALLMI|nr:hypothetical protein Y1Q_0002748 [Alligator mississippiensis]
MQRACQDFTQSRREIPCLITVLLQSESGKAVTVEPGVGKTNIKQPESFPGERKQNLNPFPTSLILPYGTQSPPPRAVFSPFLAQANNSSLTCPVRANSSRNNRLNNG